MSTYEDELKQWQAQAAAELAEVLARQPSDPLRAERKLFLITLVEAREARQLTQADLAKRVGKPQSVIARIESGRGNPGLNTLLAIAKALDANLMLEY